MQPFDQRQKIHYGLDLPLKSLTTFFPTFGQNYIANITMKRILLAEDEKGIRESVKLNLESEGYFVHAVDNGSEALAINELQAFDLVILDVMIPGTDGFTLCEKIKKYHPKQPVLFLTALSNTDSTIRGLKIAEDYLAKPFNLEELLLRVRNLVKRNENPELPQFSFLYFQIDFNSFEVKKSGKTVATLSLRECGLLKLLISKKNEVVSREEILNQLWAPDENPSSRTIDNFILNFRKIFDHKSGKSSHFQSIRGIGYKFSPENK